MFRDRKHAAGILAERLKEYVNCDGVVVAIPRGGVVLGYEIAKILNLSLEIVLTQKIGHPYNREYSIGSVSLFGAIFNDDFGVEENYIRKETEAARKNLLDKYNLYMSGREPVDYKNKTVIIADDGIATGNTMLSIIEMLIKCGAKDIIIAVPVASRSAIKMISSYVHVMIYCLIIPENFYSVSQVYENFEQVTDEEVIDLLRLANNKEKDVEKMK